MKAVFLLLVLTFGSSAFAQVADLNEVNCVLSLNEDEFQVAMLANSRGEALVGEIGAVKASVTATFIRGGLVASISFPDPKMYSVANLYVPSRETVFTDNSFLKAGNAVIRCALKQ